MCTSLVTFRQYFPVLVWSASVLDIPVALVQVWVSACARALHPQHRTDVGETCSKDLGAAGSKHWKVLALESSQVLLEQGCCLL